MLPLKKKKELQAFLSIINYLGKFSPSIAEVCESLRKKTDVSQDRMDWNATYQKIINKAKAIIKDVCMKFYDDTKPLCIEIDASGVVLGAAHLLTRSNTSCHRGKALEIASLDPLLLSAKASPGRKKIQQY